MGFTIEILFRLQILKFEFYQNWGPLSSKAAVEFSVKFGSRNRKGKLYYWKFGLLLTKFTTNSYGHVLIN